MRCNIDSLRKHISIFPSHGSNSPYFSVRNKFFLLFQDFIFFIHQTNLIQSLIDNFNCFKINFCYLFIQKIKKQMKVQSSEAKVFVSGCFDMLHSGHIAFLEKAASFGKLYVCVAPDKNVFLLKSRQTVVREQERKYMIQALKCVHQCRISRRNGYLDFIQEIKEIRPDIFVVNEDGDRAQKRELCKEMGIQYKVFKRFEDYETQWPSRSTTQLRQLSTIPYRIDLAGAWLDQPFVSQLYPGPVLTISIEPSFQFNDRSGMATSTRKKAIELWQASIPHGDKLKLAKLLFSYDNPPGTKQIAGSQDALGIVMPGLNRLNYAGKYWPDSIESINDEATLSWLENHLYLVGLGPREEEFKVLSKINATVENTKKLSLAVDECWQAILKKDLRALGRAFTEAFQAQIEILPLMINSLIKERIAQYKDEVLGYKLSGAGGGGYLICIAEKPVRDAIQIKIRRNDWL